MSKMTKDEGKALAKALLTSGQMGGLIDLAVKVLGKDRVRELLAWYLGNRGEGSTPVPPPTDIGLSAFEMDPRKLCIAGIDRNWPDYDPAEVCRAIVQSGCNATSIEMVANDRFFSQGADKCKGYYTKLLAETRKRKLTLFVCVWNDWADNKYIPTHAEKFLRFVLDAGPEGQIIQAVGETHTTKGAAFEKSALSQLKSGGFRTCYNGNGGRPTSNGGCDMRAWHTGGVNGSSSAPSGSIEITDHGQKIDYCQFVNAGRVAEVCRNAKARGAGFGFYLYVSMSDHNSPASLPLDKVIPAWREMAKIYKGASVPVPTPQPNGKDSLDISDVIEASTGNIIREQDIPITAVLKSAKVEGGNVRLDYSIPDPFWSDKANHLKFPRLYCYWEVNGIEYGGHFDWLRYGQTVKTIENVYNAYFKIHPPAGAKLHFAIVSNDQKVRTNVVKGT